jgi:hypothetical protein
MAENSRTMETLFHLSPTSCAPDCLHDSASNFDKNGPVCLAFGVSELFFIPKGPCLLQKGPFLLDLFFSPPPKERGRRDLFVSPCRIAYCTTRNKVQAEEEEAAENQDKFPRQNL